jgi:hypothetical protein
MGKPEAAMPHAFLSVLLPLAFLAAIFLALSALGAIRPKDAPRPRTAHGPGLREKLRRALASRHTPPSAPAT